jgi:uncharacterized protein (DUF2141 family)
VFRSEVTVTFQEHHGERFSGLSAFRDLERSPASSANEWGGRGINPGRFIASQVHGEVGMKLLTVILAMVSLLVVVAQAAERTGTITVTVKKLRNNNGKAGAALFSSADGFPKKLEKAFRSVSGPIKKKRAKLVFRNVPYGVYAIACVHDENGNGKIDKNIMGLPKEGYGFSKDAMGMFGPPDFEAAKIALDSPSLSLSIRVNY